MALGLDILSQYSGLIWLLVAGIIFIALVALILFVYFRVGVVYSSALMGIETHGRGIRWISGVIRQVKKKGGKSGYHFFPAGIMGMFKPPITVSTPRHRMMAQLGKNKRIIFLKLHETSDGKKYTSTLNYFEKFTVPPSNVAMTYEFLAPVNENVMSFAIDEITETQNKYPFLMKHPHLVTGAVAFMGLIAMVMVVVTINIAR